MVATRSAPDAGGRRRVVVTGLGVVTPIGFDVDSFWKAALAGASGVRRISHFDAEGLPTRIAAALADPALVEEFRAEAELDAWEPRGTVVGVRAARGAVAAAGARAVLAPPRAGGFVGTLGEAYRAIRRSTVDVALAGGAECIVSPIEVQLFCLLGVMSRQNASPETASRPFDARRDGFVIGEGAGFLLLEAADHAQRRGVPAIAELAGYGTTCDAYRITDEAPDGRGAIGAMRAALGDAGLDPEDVDYVNAHGTSTPMNDRVETAAIRAVFGPHAARLLVSSTKSMIGHTISAAGAIELATTILAVRDQIAPPTINYRVPDPECDLRYVPNVPAPARIRAAISNSFGFGGHNDCLLVREIER